MYTYLLPSGKQPGQALSPALFQESAWHLAPVDMLRSGWCMTWPVALAWVQGLVGEALS